MEQSRENEEYRKPKRKERVPKGTIHQESQ